MWSYPGINLRSNIKVSASHHNLSVEIKRIFSLDTKPDMVSYIVSLTFRQSKEAESSSESSSDESSDDEPEEKDAKVLILYPRQLVIQ